MNTSFQIVLLLAACCIVVAPVFAGGQDEGRIGKRGGTISPAGTAQGEFDGPIGVAVDSNDNIYIVDTNNHRIQKFDSSGVFLAVYGANGGDGTSGTGNGEFNTPYAIAVDSNDNFYVADSGNDRVQKFDSSGNYVTQWGSTGTGNGQFDSPRGIAVDSSDNVYVTDYNNDRLQKFDSSGSYINQHGAESFGQSPDFFDGPRGIHVTSGGDIYITDYTNGAVDQKSNDYSTGSTHDNFFGPGPGDFQRPTDVTLDSSGNIYITEETNNKIIKWEPGFTNPSETGSFGTGTGEFSSPGGIAIDSNDRLIVVDTGNNRVQIFDTSLNFQFQFGIIAGNSTPTASSVNISGTPTVGQNATGSYSYSDTDSDPEGTSILKWYYSDFSDGSSPTLIDFATGSSSLSLTGTYENKYIIFEVTPVASAGSNPGTPVESATFGPIMPQVAPTVTTTAPSGVSSTEATLGGTVTSDGGAVVFERGIVYNTTGTPTTSDTKVQIGSGTGAFSQLITGLTQGTTYYVRAYAINGIGTSYGSEESFFTPSTPTVTTTAASGVGSNAATLGGNVTADGGSSVTERGIVYNTTGTPTTSDTKVQIGSGTGVFSQAVTGLTPGTMYHVRAYGINSQGTGYGSEVTFTTDAIPPTVTTDAASNINNDQADLGGDVTDDGGATVTERGVVYNTSGSPTTSDTKVQIGSGTGTFSQTVSGLTLGQMYYVRAYAINSEGTSYGTEQSFTADTNAPTVTTDAPSGITDSGATVGGDVTDDGGDAVTERGVVYNTSGTPTTSDSKLMIGSGTGTFSDTLTGLSPGTMYYVRAYAINGQGTSYGGEQSFTTDTTTASLTTAAATNINADQADLGGEVTSNGGDAVTERGVVYNTSGTPTTSDTKVQIGSGTGVFSQTVSGLTLGQTYFVRAYAINGNGTAYGSQISFTAGSTPPTVSTTAPSGVSATTATVGGTVTNDGGSAVTERGVVYNTSGTPTTSDSKLIIGSGTGAFGDTLTGLSAGTMYYVRAYAINSQGTSYGSEQSFTTIAQYTVTVNSTAGGSTDRDGTTVVDSGDSLTITATANSGFSFDGWSGDAGGSANPLTLASITSDLTITANFSSQASLQVLIDPAEARDAGAGWRIRDDEVWLPSGHIIRGLPAGDYFIEFRSIDGYAAPPERRVEIPNGVDRTITATYVDTSEPTGSVSVQSGGATGLPAGTDFGWRIQGGDGAVYSTGQQITLPEGTYIIEFLPIPGWYAPPIEITVEEGQELVFLPSYGPLDTGNHADYSFDGLADPILWDPETGQWLVGDGTSAAGISAATFNAFSFGGPDGWPAPGDYDGNGRMDPAVWYPERGVWRIRGQYKLEEFGQQGDIPVPADYDGDGITDPALYSPESRLWTFALSSKWDRSEEDTPVIRRKKLKKAAVGMPVPADYDGDGRDEIALYDPASGVWYVDGQQDQFFGGEDGDIPMPADYDGDGTDEPAIANMGDGLWRVLGGESFEFNCKADDIPSAIDFDGDGAADFSWYRARKSGIWFFDNGTKLRFGDRNTIPVTR